MKNSGIYSVLLDDLTSRYGELIGGGLLGKVLGFPSIEALKRAIERKTLTIPTFFIPGRRGRFALTADVAEWLANCKANADDSSTRVVPANFKKKSGLQ